MTREELLQKLKTEDGKQEVAMAITQVWWDRLDMDDVEEMYFEITIDGYPGLMSCTEEEWIEYAIDAGLVEEV